MNDILILRKRLGLTQEQFAHLIGVTTFTIRRWEKGTTHPSPLALRVIKGLIDKMAPEAASDATTSQQAVPTLFTIRRWETDTTHPSPLAQQAINKLKEKEIGDGNKINN